MKILFFSTYFYPHISGLTIYPLRILNHLVKKNKITVLTFTKTDQNNDTSKFEIISLPYFFKYSKGFISPQSLIYFFAQAKKNDLVVLNLPNFEGLFLAFLARLFGKKIISIYHCQVDLGPGIASKIVTLFLNTSIFIQLLLSDKIIGHIDYVDKIMNTRWLKNKTVKTLPPIETLPVSKKYFGELKKKKKGFWIGFAGRISREKGLEYLIRAIGEMANVWLVIAGPVNVVGESEYRNKIKKLLAQQKINYIFLGELTRSQLGAFYKVIDVLALTSFNKTEAFGMSQAEAMILGTPVIATDLPGIRVPINRTQMGIVVDSKDPHQIKEAIDKIKINRQKYSNNKLVSEAKKIFNINKVFNFFDEIIYG